jgi:hypothetical protein
MDEKRLGMDVSEEFIDQARTLEQFAVRLVRRAHLLHAVVKLEKKRAAEARESIRRHVGRLADEADKAPILIGVAVTPPQTPWWKRLLARIGVMGL